MFSNYPPGVTGHEPVFEDSTVEVYVECQSADMEVVPSYKVKEILLEIRPKASALTAPGIRALLDEAIEEVFKLEDMGSWDCTFKGRVDAQVVGTDEATWDCPVCGTTEMRLDLKELGREVE